jgi:hypothetical protein
MTLLPGMFFTICAVGVSSPTLTIPIPFAEVQVSTTVAADTVAFYDFNDVRYSTETLAMIRKAWHGNLTPEEQTKFASLYAAVVYGTNEYGNMQVNSIGILNDEIASLKNYNQTLSEMLARVIGDKCPGVP